MEFLNKKCICFWKLPKACWKWYTSPKIFGWRPYHSVLPSKLILHICIDQNYIWKLKYGSNANPIFLIFEYFDIPILPKYLMRKEWSSISNLNNYIFVKHEKSLNIKGYRLFDLRTNKLSFNRKVIIKKDAIFLGTKTNTSKVEPNPLNVSIFYDLMPLPSCCTISS